jgi:hypothetical protein
MKDALGRELAVGDLVVYPVTSGRAILMRAGRVIEVGEKNIRLRPESGHLSRDHWRDRYPGVRKDVTIHRVENVVRVGFGEWGAP